MKNLLSTSLGLVAVLIVVSCTPQTPSSPEVPPSPVTAAYRTWVLAQGDEFVVQAGTFAEAIRQGNRDQAKSLYAPSRMYFERIEPIAEALGDFDPRIDAREGDVPDAEWRGYHKIEKILWSDASLKEAVPVAEALLADVKLLRAKLETAEISVAAMLTGAVELLNEVSSSKVTGEEERYSRTDLWDFQANVEGAEQIWRLLSDQVTPKDPELAKTLDARFGVLYGLLSDQKKGGAFRPYNEVAPKDVQALAAAVDALAEPLAQLGKHFVTE